MDLKRVVITGLGTINPLGHNVPVILGQFIERRQWRRSYYSFRCIKIPHTVCFVR